MKRDCLPKYYFFRIYLAAIIFYFLIVFSAFFYISLRSAPHLLLKTDLTELAGSGSWENISDFDYELEKRIHKVYGSEKKFDRLTDLIFFLLLLATIAGFIVNLPFKRYFYRLKRDKTIPPELTKYCKRHLSQTPLINALTLFAAFTIVHIILIALSYKIDQKDVVMQSANLQFIFVSIVSSTLSVFFVYNWQKHRIHHNYIDRVFRPNELRNVKKRLFEMDKIKYKLLLTNLMTTFLPLTIVIFYLLKSIDVIGDISTLNSSQLEILMGDFSTIIKAMGVEELFLEKITDKESSAYGLIYISSINTIQMLLGIFSGLAVALIYLFLFIKWTTIDIVCPIKSLLERMKMVANGELDNFAIVRANDEVGEVTAGFNKMLKGLQERERLKSLFGQYLTREISEEILKGNVNLGGDLYEATVMFTDIRNFTAISEKISPAEVFTFLNEYLDRMIDVILKYNGIIDKFIGDGILAIFGVPIRSDAHQKEAVMAALEMQSELARMNREREERGEFPIKIGIGLHSGSLIAGNIGNNKKLEYTVIGDTVNIASRVEKLTKEYKTGVLISETTYNRLDSDFKSRLKSEEIKGVTIRGKEELLTLYKLN